MRKGRPTIIDVAQKAGVSKSTVSLVLQNSPTVREETREKVRAAMAEMARGLLVHAVRVEGGRIADYAIVAPTEWNFHPRGALFRELSGRPVRDEGEAKRNSKDAENIAPGFRISGLGQLVEAGIQADRLVVFGD